MFVAPVFFSSRLRIVMGAPSALPLQSSTSECLGSDELRPSDALRTNAAGTRESVSRAAASHMYDALQHIAIPITLRESEWDSPSGGST